ncbi:hypothetical protein SNE40_013950 [Patella caerulea]|uniref:VWFA domain-containing protein n=1 Tax=Patella caerulea TaxID=87958 RepID=A0AAN8JEL3_PATCE
MAVNKKRYRLLEIYFSFLLFGVFKICESAKLPPTLDQVTQWSEELGDDLDKMLNMISALQIVDLNYQKAADLKNQGKDVHVSFERVHSRTIVTDLSAALSVMLGKKMEALKRSVDVAEAAAANHTWNQTLEKKDVAYYNSNDMPEALLSYDDRFQQHVSFNVSSVHIPVEIYDGDIQILNGLKWSAALDEVFRQNYEEDSEILWQYFGSQTGFMRTLPASKWIKHGPVDLYDVRRQSWYTQGSSSPKDMMILIDTSGSTHGQALQLMKVAVKSILDTLGENDFVNIASFSQEVSFVGHCFNHSSFVQANYRNKKKLARDVDQLKAHGMADFKVGLRFAFEQFELFEKNNSKSGIGATCNKVIMLLTDGGTDNAEEIFKEYNWSNNKSVKAEVRVFTYAVGPTANPTNAIRWMACANRGYFSQIPAMGAIRARVQGYTKYLAESYQYADVREMTTQITRDPHGLGMMTTVTLPVYNRTAGSSNQTILGVMGIDVTTADLESKAPKSQLGPNGYAFAINPNGYVIFHPNLKPSETYLDDPPDVDILEVEINNPDKQKLRNFMIDGNDNSMNIDTLVLSPSLKYVSRANTTYAFTSIKNTSFSLGVSIPTYQASYPKFLGDILMFNHSVFKSSSYVRMIAPWDYCQNMSRFDGLSGTIDDIIQLLKERSANDSSWNKELLFQLYWDLKVMNSLEKYYTMLESEGKLDGLIIAFVATNGGLTQIYQHSENQTMEEHRDTWKADYYKRTLNTDKYMFVPPEPIDLSKNESGIPQIMVSHSVIIKDGTLSRVIYKPAVVGVKITHDKIQEKLINDSEKFGLQYPLAYHCNESDYLSCHLLDDGGFLVSTNQEDLVPKIGEFFGKIDPSVMERLLNVSVYNRNKHFNYQASCVINDDDTTSAGFTAFKIPSINLLFDFLSVNWWSAKFSWLYINFNIYNWLFPEPTYVYGVEDGEIPKVKTCVQVMYQYYYGGVDKYDDNINCDNCTRKVIAVRLTKNNLILLVTDPICQECSMFKPLLQQPQRVSEDEEDDEICQLSEEPRYRKHPISCYDQDDREDESKCGSGSIFYHNTLHLLLSCSLMLSIVWLLTNSVS